MVQKQTRKLNELEETAQEQAQHVLERANRMRMEQEDEIKEFNEVGTTKAWVLASPFPPPHPCVRPRLAGRAGDPLSPQLLLGAKCHMIRDAQILEKQIIAKELDEEDKRLDNMMEVERRKAEEMQEELERRRKQELLRSVEGSLFPGLHTRAPRRDQAAPDVRGGISPCGNGTEPEGTFCSFLPRGRQGLARQMEQNAEERALRAELRDQEAQELRQYLERLKLEDLKVRAQGAGGAGAGFPSCWKGAQPLLPGHRAEAGAAQADPG